MPATQTNVDAALAAVNDIAARGAQSITAGDKRIEYVDPMKLRALQKSLDEEVNGGTYSMIPEPKGHY
jgi:hypothetical protein